MSRFFMDAQVTGSDSTVMSGRYPRWRSSALNNAAVAATSVQACGLDPWRRRLHDFRLA